MCGIYGQHNFQSLSPVVEESVKKATHTLAHRGPDDEGFYFSGPLGLGFRRLSIIDLADGHQPMCDSQGSVCLVFNGEIYNFVELRRQLEGRGHIFRTKSDTEVILHGYKEWGEAVFNHLNGMFGLAIWDDTKKKLILARDAMGIKPVYYKIKSGSVFFGSEIRAIRAGAGEDLDIDPVSLNLFLRYRYTPSPLTLFQGIQKLPPGSLMVFENGSFRLERWYRFKPAPFSPLKTLGEAKEELTHLYNEAVKRHLLSDVPVGLLLSGGIDSGLLLALMNSCGDCWPTFSVGYGKDFQDDELTEAERTAEMFSARHVSLRLSRETFEDSLLKVVASLEEPVAASSIVPMYMICERARHDVKVALIGQGPDELFGGYIRHLGVHYGNVWRKVPAALRRVIASSVAVLPRSEALKRAMYSLDVPDRLKRYQSIFSILPGQAIDQLFQDGILEPDAGDSILDCWADLEPSLQQTDELGGFQFLEVRSSLPDELLIYADKLSMAHGLEVRVPYLDREIVEYTQNLNACLKIRNGSRKFLHRMVCSDFLPREITQRKKRGFAVNVVDDWFRRSLSSKMDDLLMDEQSLMYRFLRPAAVRRLLQEHRSGANDNHKVLFSLVVFEQWLRSAATNSPCPASLES